MVTSPQHPSKTKIAVIHQRQLLIEANTLKLKKIRDIKIRKPREAETETLWKEIPSTLR